MMPSVMPDSREPVPTSSGFAISRRGRPGELAATRAAGEEGCRGRAFEDADAAPRAPHCARIITSHQKDEAAPPSSHGDSHRPHCKSVTVAQPPGRGSVARPPHCTRRVSGRDFDTPIANRCTQVITGDALEVCSAAGGEISRFNNNIGTLSTPRSYVRGTPDGRFSPPTARQRRPQWTPLPQDHVP